MSNHRIWAQGNQIKETGHACILVLSLAVTTAIVSTAALAAGESKQNFIRILAAPKPAVSAPVVPIKAGPADRAAPRLRSR